MKLLDVSFQIFRYKPGESPHYDTFTVQVPDTAHVLDAIDTAWVCTITASPFAVPVTIPPAVPAHCALMASKSSPASRV